ncbi:MAG: YihY/virulence factor BrkB family protein [Acidobacteria bacterium]|nr:YihY/virulence factor BrkB family protein [Acidobacteriota bacterium]
MATTDRVEQARQTPRLIGRAVLHAIYNSLRGGSLLQAQAVAFNMFLGFFPALVFLAGVLIYAAPGFEDLLEGLQVVLPPGSRRAVVDSLLKAAEHPSRLVVAGAVGTLMLGSQLMFSLNRIFATISDREERRGFWFRQLRAFGMVLVTVVPWVAVSLLVVFGKFVRTWLIEELGVGFDRPVRILWTMGYFALAILTATLVLAALYYFLSPDPRQRWHHVLPGAALAMGLWWIVTAGFGFYVRGLAIYNILYGGFAAAIGLLIWMYLSAVVVLIGAQFNAELATLRTRYDLY